ncbi:hypothetical protein [Flavobacterium sp. XGLA_31]|uniref:hypothetical protein n=1 Tax=Flavobacterium sp. XGLA_31 TaxID=3447666 RepID=UPI003F2CD9DC
MKQKNKEIFVGIFVGIITLGLTLLLFTLAVVGYKNSTIDLGDVPSCMGSVTEKGIALKRGKVNLNVFYFRINGTDEKFASYNEEQDYSKLNENIAVGDYLKVYFKKTQSSDFNLDVIQIEKKGKILLAKSEYESKENSLIYIGIIGGFAMLALVIKVIRDVTAKVRMISTSAESGQAL